MPVSSPSRAGPALDALNFFLADVRDGLGPYLAIYLLAVHHWDEASIGTVMSIAGGMGIIAQAPAGALVDRTDAKRGIIVAGAIIVTITSLLVPLVDHDKLNNAYLVSSLEAFLAPGTDISTAAGQLYVHVNTLRNRLAKIAELTGANPLDETDRTNFRIALWAARNMGMGGGTPAAEPGAKPVQRNVIQPSGGRVQL